MVEIMALPRFSGQELGESSVEKASLATLPGIEPGLPFHKADTLKPLQT
jgi:hypothetical protein